MTDKDRDFAMEAAGAVFDLVISCRSANKCPTSERIADLIRPIIEAAQAAARPEVVQGDGGE